MFKTILNSVQEGSEEKISQLPKRLLFISIFPFCHEIKKYFVPRQKIIPLVPYTDHHLATILGVTCKHTFKSHSQHFYSNSESSPLSSLPFKISLPPFFKAQDKFYFIQESFHFSLFYGCIFLHPICSFPEPTTGLVQPRVQTTTL